jgi:hypothetical protein
MEIRRELQWQLGVPTLSEQLTTFIKARCHLPGAALSDKASYHDFMSKGKLRLRSKYALEVQRRPGDCLLLFNESFARINFILKATWGGQFVPVLFVERFCEAPVRVCLLYSAFFSDSGMMVNLHAGHC